MSQTVKGSIISTAVAVALLAFGATAFADTLAVPAACSSAATPIITGTEKITEPDSGTHGDWANDKFTENVSIYQATDGTGTFCAVGYITNGTFTTTGPLSPQNGVALNAGITGTMTGSETWVFPAGTATTSNDTTFSLTDNSPSDGQFNDWQTTVFGAKTGATDFSFNYIVDGDSSDTWTNSSAPSGDIVNPTLSSVFVDAASGSDTNSGQSGHPFKTIQAGVNAVAAGGAVHVAAGTYNENVTVSKNLSLDGIQAGVAAADASTSVARTGSESSVSSITVTSGGVDVNGFTFTNAGNQVTVSSASTALSGVVIRNNIFSGYTGVALVPDNAGNISIANNLFETPSGSGEAMQIKDNTKNAGCSGTSVDGNVFVGSANINGADVNLSCTDSNSDGVAVTNNRESGNTGGSSFTAFSGVTGDILISHNTVSDASGSAIFFFGDVSGAVTIADNVITGGAGSAVSIHGGDGCCGTNDPANSGSFTITGNDFSGNATGISVASGALTGSLVANTNNLSNEGTAGVTNNSSVTLDATKNYWGTTPVVGVNITGSGDVTFSPWYSDSAMTIATTNDGTTATSTVANTTTVTGNSTDGGNVTVTVTIPAGTNVTSDAGWDGTIAAPTATTTTVTLGGNLTATVKAAVEVGSSGHNLQFDKAVELVFPGMAGNDAGWYDASYNFTPISTTCSAGDQTANLAAGADCRTVSGSDMIIWTKHFSTFVVYSAAVNGSGSVSSGGGGGGGNGPISGGGGGSGAVVVLPNNGGAASTGTTNTGTTGTTNSGSTGGQVLGAATYNFAVNLTVGSRGQDVVELQNVLIAEGDLAAGLNTGYFGSLTKAAVVKYQAAHSISPTSGYVGPLTRAELNKGSTPSMTDEQKSVLLAQLLTEVQSLQAQLAALTASSTTSTSLTGTVGY